MANTTDVVSAIRELTNTKQLDRGELLDLLKDGLHAALVKRYGPNVRAEIGIDELKGTIRIVVLRTVVETVEDPGSQVSLEEARFEDPDFQEGDTIRAVLKRIEETPKGPRLILSRADPLFVKALFKLEVPEIQQGVVEIRATAREAGSRTKIAVSSRDDAIDPVGACVGLKGSRVQAVVNELGGERIDIVPWSPDPERFAKLALAPARVARVFSDPDSRTIQAIVDEDQLSLAIGRNGQNVRLASELTGWKIDLYSSREGLEAGGGGPTAAGWRPEAPAPPGPPPPPPRTRSRGCWGWVCGHGRWWWAWRRYGRGCGAAGWPAWCWPPTRARGPRIKWSGWPWRGACPCCGGRGGSGWGRRWAARRCRRWASAIGRWRAGCWGYTEGGVATTRVHDLAAGVGVSSEQLVGLLKEVNIFLRSHLKPPQGEQAA